MRERSLQTLIRIISFLLWILCDAFALEQVAAGFTRAPEALAGRLLLAASALACVRIWRRGVSSIASASLLAALTIWPDAWSLALGLIVLAAGARWVSGPDGRDTIHAVSSSSVAWCVAYAFVTAGVLPPAHPAELMSALTAGLAWSLFSAVRWILEQAFGRQAGGSSRRTEWLNPVLAWLLAVLAGLGWVGFLVAPLTVVAQALMVRLARTRGELREVRAALESRTAELLTLHAVGRELLSSKDDARLGPLLDRECRKLFDPESFTLLLAGDDGLRTVYRRRGERHDTRCTSADPDLERRLDEDKRGICWRSHEDPLPIAAASHQARSVLIAPLVVENRVAGALIVESRIENRYDEHQLAVLTTLAQQAAAALESAQQQRRATIDSLTGFFLREYFFERLEEEQRRARRYGGSFALLMIDLDGFKSINDRHGHLVGDHYLRAVARAIREQLRGADMPCRYGGDEFALLLPETDMPGACTIAERIRKAVSHLETDADGVLLRGTVSIGLAAFPDHGKGDAKSLMRHADEALYRAKRAGRDRVVPYAA